MERLERKYGRGEISATRLLDEASHFFDTWNVQMLDNEWNEMYGAYILQIDEPRTASGFDEMNRQLPDVDVDQEEPRPQQPPGDAAGAAAPSRIIACTVCYQEMNHDNWFIVRPCRHCFCESCVNILFPPKLDAETYAEHFMRCQPCPTCRGNLIEVEKIFPNYIVLTEGDLFVPAVNDDDDNAAAAVAAAAAVELEEELEDNGAAARRLENQRMIADLMHSNNHRTQARPHHRWDMLDDEVELEDFDLSQPHSQSQDSQRPLAAIGEAPPARGRGSRGSRGSRGRCGRRGPPQDRQSQIRLFDHRAQSILRTRKPQSAPGTPTGRQSARTASAPATPDYNNPQPGTSGMNRTPAKKRVRIIGSSSESDD